MRDLLLLTAFVFIMAYLQARASKKVLRYNSNLTTTQSPIRDKGIYMTIALVVMMFLAMFRGVNIGNDTDDYQAIFINIISNSDYASTARYELGYVFLNKLVGKFSTNPQSIIMVTSFIYYVIFIWFLKKHSRNYALSIIFAFFTIFGASMNLIRQGLATAFILVAYDKVINKKVLSAYLWIIIAFLFHSSAIIFVVLPLMPYIKIKKSLAIFITIIVIVLTITNALFRVFDIVAPQYSHYFGGQYTGSGALAITYQLLRNLAFLIVIGFVRIKIKDNKIAGKSRLGVTAQNNLVAWMTFIPVVMLIFGYRINLINRVTSYFVAMYMIYIPNALNKYDRNSRNTLAFAMVFIMTAYSIVAQIYRPEWNIIYPYQFFWN